jgi:YNFM family putative membrane transporter
LIAFASTACGPLSDLVGRKPIMVWSCALLSIPTLLCAVAPSFGALLFFRALQGIFIPGVTAVAVAYIGDMVEPSALGGAVGGWIAANVAGGLTGRVASGLITDLIGWHWVFVIFAALTLLCAVLMQITMPHGPLQHHRGWANAYRGMFAHLRNRRLVGAFLIGGALFFGFLGTFTYLPYYLTSTPFNLSPGVVAFAYVTYLAGVITSPLAGWLSRKISRRVLMAVGILMAVAGIVLTLLPAVSVIAIGLIILCSGMFTAQGIAPAFVNVVAQQAKGGAAALYLMCYYIGGTIGGVLPGLGWQAAGWQGVVVVCLVALFIALFANLILCRE